MGAVAADLTAAGPPMSDGTGMAEIKSRIINARDLPADRRRALRLASGILKEIAG